MKKYNEERRRRRLVGFSVCCLVLVFLPLIIFGSVGSVYLLRSSQPATESMLEANQTQTVLLGMDDMLNAGDVIQVTSIITNTGDDPVENVTIVDDPTIMTICVPSGTLLPGETATCFGMHVITQMDIDAAFFYVNSTVTGDSIDPINVDSSSDLTQTTFGALSVGQMATIDLGVDEFLNAGDIVEVVVKLMNVGTETLLNLISSSFVGVITPELLPMESINFTYTITLTQPMLDDGTLTLNETGIGIGTTSALPVEDTNILEVNVTQPLIGLLKTTTTFMKTSPCAQVGDILMISVLVENDGTAPVDNVVVENTLVGAGLICAPMGVDNTIAQLLAGQSQLCTGGYMLMGSDVTFGIDTLFTSNTSATATGGITGDEINVEFVYDAVSELYFQTVTSTIPTLNGLSSANFYVSTGAVLEYTDDTTPPANCRNAIQYRVFSNMAGKANWFNNFVLTPRHLSASLYVGDVDSGSIRIETNPPNLFVGWTTVITGAGIWNPATGEGTRIGAAMDVSFTFSIHNLPDITSLAVRYIGTHPTFDFTTVSLSETVNTTINF